MDNLLALAHADRVRSLRIEPGKPPIVERGDESHPLEGPPLSEEEVEHLLHGLADSRHLRMLRELGRMECMYYFRQGSPFLVRASIVNDQLRFEVS